MKEGAAGLEKGDPRRKSIADQIRDARQRDRAEDYFFDRSGVQYVFELSGVQHLFDYVRGLKSRKILDIGAGYTRGIHDLAESSLGTGLEFEATVLSNFPGIDAHLGRENVTVTSAEVLRGIGSESIGCIISIYSIAYSAEPKLAIESINRVLVPGGILKAVFLPNEERRTSGLEPKYSKEFEDVLTSLGYDVAMREGDGGDVIVAIKPLLGSVSPVSAAVLVNGDLNTIISQFDSVFSSRIDDSRR